MLEAKGLAKLYGRFQALFPLDLAVQSGEVFCLLGANGAGKTTTLHLFLDFIRPSAGAAFVDGIHVADAPVEAKRRIGYIPEQVSLYDKLTGMENLDFFCGLAGCRLSLDRQRELMDMVGLSVADAERRVQTYSKGMRQKVALAVAMGKDVKALLLDEPTSGLDPAAAKRFSELIQQVSQNGTAVLMATHDLFRAKQLATRVGVMRGGRMVDVQSTSELSMQRLESLYLSHMDEVEPCCVS